MSQEGSYFVKFLDNAALLTLLRGQDSGHGQAPTCFQCVKTKELIIYFRQSQDTPRASTIHNEKVQIVDSYKFLGMECES